MKGKKTTREGEIVFVDEDEVRARMGARRTFRGVSGLTRSFDELPSINSGPELVEGRIDPEQASTELVRLRLTTEVSRMSGRTGRNWQLRKRRWAFFNGLLTSC